MSNQGVGVSAMSSLLEPPDVQRFEQDLEGRIVLASPPGWKAYGGLLALTAAISGLAAGTVSIEKSVLISGKIIPMGGDVEVSHMSEGYVSEIRVRPGQSVRKGDILIVMANERAGRDGGDVSGGLREQMEIQAQAVERQISGLGENFAAQTDELETRRIAAAEAIESYQRRLALSTQRHELVESQVRQMQSLVDRGFGARLELDRRREVLLLASQDLEQAGAQLSAARRDYDAVGSQLRVIRARERAEAATLSSSLADVRERIALRSLEDGEAVRAPVSGVVSSVSTRTGRRPSGNDSLITLRPNGNGFEGELTIAAESVRFLRRGKRIGLRIDAFPHRRFGEVGSQVEWLGPTPAGSPAQASQAGQARPYVAIVRIDEDANLLRRRIELQPEMLVTARVGTERISLWRAVLETISGRAAPSKAENLPS